MSRLVSRKCPSCGAILQIDPDVPVASCGACGASAFVQTSKRRAPSPRPGFVIDVDPVVSAPWLALLAFPMLAIAVLLFAWENIRENLPGALKRSKPPPEPVTAAAAEAPEAAEIEPAPMESPEREPIPALPPATTPEDPAPKAVSPRTGRSRGTVRAGTATISERLEPHVVQKVVRQSFGRIRACYERGLARDPGLEGKIEVRFVIARDGRVSNAVTGITFPDEEVRHCIRESFYGLTFPKPKGGIVTVTYPLTLARER